MAKQHKQHKTNAMRLLDAAGVDYECTTFACEATATGVEIARMAGKDPDTVFKTLVTQGRSGEHYVFLVPVASGLDLKKAAAVAGEKAIEMVRAKELLPLTGYVHGGCSPLGMKKQFATFVDETAQLHERISFSGGKIGCQLTLDPAELPRALEFAYADVATVAAGL